MLESSAKRILERIDEHQVVLDLGGWGKPFTRADWVIDLMPYETRGLYGRDGEGEERFGPDTWIQRDLCDREPYPFADDEIDFVVCSHTLEDVRDPVWVCREINRIGKAGYVEVPSRLEEQSYGVQGPWVGWGHHHWLVEISDGRIDFAFKHHIIHGRESDHFPAGFHSTLGPEERVATLWWEGGFEYGERVFVGPEALDPYLAGFVARNLRERGFGDAPAGSETRPKRRRRLLARLLR
jgi:Methyltransferase domain